MERKKKGRVREWDGIGELGVEWWRPRGHRVERGGDGGVIDGWMEGQRFMAALTEGEVLEEGGGAEEERVREGGAGGEA